ncbi:MAG TPA: shikimate kinase [Thermoplasmata archaeon]|nr:shikimate kinase [Thermoplasmata archaeon]
MKAHASCFGAGTIVNAIATGRGAAFGLGLRANATAVLVPRGAGVAVHVPVGVDPALAEGTARRVLRRSRRKAGLEVTVDSEIPMSRGLKSSSAVANAVALASSRALGLDLEPMQIIGIGVDAALEAKVTITGAFDDACASFFGAVAITDNRARRLLRSDRLMEGLVAVVQIPRRMITKPSLAGKDFSPIRPQVEEAFRLALEGDYFHAIEVNSAAYAKILEVDESPAVRARSAGAMAAGITGAGPAIIALTKPTYVEAVTKALAQDDAEVRAVPMNTIEAREVPA